MNDSRKTTDWFDAQLRKAKDDFARLGKVDRNAEKNKERENPNALRRSATSSGVARKPRPPASDISPPLEEKTVNRGPEKETLRVRTKQAPSSTATPSVAERDRLSPRRSTGQSGYRLGADVGGTFTDILLIEESTGHNYTAKVLSTPQDSSIGVLNGIERVCDQAGISPTEITHVMHGTTVATNTVLTANGAKVGLVTTKGYKQVLQIARSYVPGGLGGWVIFNKSCLLYTSPSPRDRSLSRMPSSA